MSFFSTITGANKEVARLTAELTAAKAEVTTHLATIAELQKDNEALGVAANTAKEQITAAEQAKATADAKAAKLETDLAAEKADKAKIAASVQAEAEKIASAKALAITQGQGQPPVDSVPAAGAQKADGKKLTGLERAIAAHKAGYAAKK